MIWEAVVIALSSMMVLPAFSLAAKWWAGSSGHWDAWLTEANEGLQRQGWSCVIERTHIHAVKGSWTLDLHTNFWPFPQWYAVQITLECPSRRFIEGLCLTPEGGRRGLPWLLSRDLRVGDQKVDELLYFQAREPALLKKALRNDAARSLLRDLLESSSWLEVRPGRAKNTWIRAKDATELELRIGRLESLVHRLQISGTQGAADPQTSEIHPWKCLADRLEFKFRDTRPHGSLHMEGGRCGHPVEIEARGDGESSRIWLQVQLLETMPVGLQILPRVDDLAASVSLYNPILDGRVSAFGQPADKVRALLNHGAMVPALMSAFQAGRGVRIRDQSVEMDIQGMVEETDRLVEVLDEMVELADALDLAAREI